MRAFFKTLLIFIVILSFSLPVAAAPAPPLTDVQIVGVTSDGNNYEWENISRNQLIANVPLSGTEAVFKIYVEGTDLLKRPAVYLNGENITSSSYRKFADEYLSGPDRIVYGKYQYYAVPLDVLGDGGRVYVEYTNYYAPRYRIGDGLNVRAE